jgi:hypothetical protein
MVDALREENPPRPRLVFRVGVTGHLELADDASPQGASIIAVIGAVLDQIAAEVEKIAPEFAGSLAGKRTGPENQKEVRLLTQLAAGVDQKVATLAMQRGYRVSGVLPFHKQTFAEDIQNSKGGPRAREAFDRLIGAPQVDAVFELPGDAATPESRDQAYAEANRVILHQSDLLMVLVRKDAPYRYGGSVWLEEQAFDERISVIHIPLDTPYGAELVWSRGGQQCRALLFDTGSTQPNGALIGILLKGILTTTDRQPPISRLTSTFLSWERSFQDWDHVTEDVTERWAGSPDDRSVISALGDVPEHIDAAYRGAYCWADYLARGYSDIYRRAFLFTTVLGLVAVGAGVAAGALGMLHDNAATAFKVLEFLVMLTVLWMYSREKKMRWRIRWLNYRQLAEQFRHSRYLLLLGRAIPIEAPVYMQEFHADSDWSNWYVRAFMRQASLPNARIDRDYLEAVRWLLETRQVSYQYEYYAHSSKKQEKTDARLDQMIGVLVRTVLVLLFVYLASHILANWLSLEKWKAALDYLKPWITAVSAILPAVSAALSAIKSHGQYAQNALRYRGMAVTLEEMIRELAQQRGAPNGDLARAYNSIARLASSTAAYLLQEVYQWRTILQMKGLERS